MKHSLWNSQYGNQDENSQHVFMVKEEKYDPTLFVEKENVSYLDFVLRFYLRPSQPNGVMSSAVSLPNHTFTGQA